MKLYLVQMDFYGDKVIMTHAAKSRKEVRDYINGKYGDVVENYLINEVRVKGYDIILKGKNKWLTV